MHGYYWTEKNRKIDLLRALEYILTSSLVLTSIAAAKELPVADISKKIFDKEMSQRTCKVISRSPKDDVSSYDPDLQKLINSVIENVRNQKKLEMMGLFHPRLSVSKKQLDRSFKKLTNTVGKISSIGIYRLWAINTVDGTPSLVPCVDDALALGPHYGYNLQFGLWLQVMGDRELGRIYATIVPSQNKWRLGAWHVQQWTHMGKDPQAWVEEALADAAKGKKFSAYLKIDVAEKLLEGGGYIFAQLKNDIDVTKATYFTKERFLEYFRNMNISPNAEVVTADSIFAKDGAGIGVRFMVNEKLYNQKNQALVDLCKSAAQAIYSKAQDPTLGGLRCGFLIKGEESDRDGKLGSRFIPRSEVKLVQPAR
jgi:hypothetical protein